MAQAKVTSYYNTRKRTDPNAPVKLKNVAKTHVITSDIITHTVKDAAGSKGKTVRKIPESTEIPTNKIKLKTSQATVTKATVTKVKKTTTVKKTKKVVPQVKSNIVVAFEVQKEAIRKKVSNDIAVSTKAANSTPAEAIKELERQEILKDDLPTTPTKRNLCNPEQTTPSKKAKCPAVLFGSDIAVESQCIESHLPVQGKKLKAQKQLSLDKHDDHMLEEKDSYVTATVQVTVETPQALEKQAILKKQSVDISLDAKLKIASSDRKKEVAESLRKIDKQLHKLKEFQNNSFLISSSITPKAAVSSEVTNKREKELHDSLSARHRFGNLATPGLPTLTLPFKFKLLLEMFQNTDIIVSLLNNRKETCTFGKLRSSVQTMLKKTFTKSHFGQIVTVFPTAYHLRMEKTDSAFINQKHGVEGYQLVILPNLDGSAPTDQESPGLSNKQKSVKGVKSITSRNQSNQTKTQSFVQMPPSAITERKQMFSQLLLRIAMRHHKNFLSKLVPPVVIPEEKLRRWHPKFAVDHVPDIEVAVLPEPPEQKFNTARDVLNKIKEKTRGKVERALQSVADKNLLLSPNDPTKQKAVTSVAANPSSSVLKGICTDLLERIRARENAKIVESMTRNSEEEKRAAMLQRVPEMVRILRTYFIVERRTAILLEDVVQKVIDSFHSPLTTESVKEHIQLIKEVLPDWLSFHQITKGTFLKIDKNKNINEMIDNLPCL